MSSDLTRQLQKLLEGANRIAVLGIGSEIRGDDRVGLLVARLLQRAFRSAQSLRAYCGSTAPENFVGEIKRFRPSHLLLVDAADTGATPGSIQLITLKTVSGLSASTHAFPVNALAEYMRRSIGCDVYLVGIQPRRLELNEKLTPEVAHAARQVAAALRMCLFAEHV